MQIAGPQQQPLMDELEFMRQAGVLAQSVAAGADQPRVLDLGCGAADKSRALLAEGRAAAVVAAEVDARQHARNLANPAPGLRFAAYGAEAIGEPDASFDAVLMFKSLHHVPLPALPRAMAEIHRVLRPGGVAWISEPVFAGAFNDVIRLFHDEQAVRQAAFEAVRDAVAQGPLTLVAQHFFRNELRLPDFDAFADRVMHATHTEHRLTPALIECVRERFEQNQGPGRVSVRSAEPG